MKFTCERETIMREIANAAEIISSRNAISVLANVYLHASDNQLIIRATDLKVSYEGRAAVEVVSPGTTTVICDKLLGILRSLPEGEVEFEQAEDHTLNVRPVFRKIDFQLRGMSPDKYPEFQDADDALFFELPQKDLSQMISQTLFAVSDDEGRYFMNGVFMESQGGKLVLAATDSHRLAYISKPLPAKAAEFKGIIVPPKIMSVVRKFASGEGNLSLAVTDKNVHVRLDTYRMNSGLIDAQFPNVQRVIPDKQEHQLIVARADLLDGLRRVSLLVEQKSRRVHLEVGDGKLVVRASEGEVGTAQEEVECKYQGPEFKLALNYIYLLEPLKEIDAEQVCLEFSDPNRALTLKPVPESDFFHIIMPMQSA